MTKRKKPEDKLKMGRPESYNEDLVSKILHEVATCEDGLDIVCARNPEFPAAKTIYSWMFRHPDFRQRYFEAKESQGVLYGESTIRIADELLTKIAPDPITGLEKIDGGVVAAYRAVIAARQWGASRLAPKRFGDKQIIETNNSVSEEERKELIALRAQLAEKNKSAY